MNSEIRDLLNEALNHVAILEHGLALCCRPIEDEDQRSELLHVKKSILKALEASE